jgi:plastocyanin/uncharacterized membrane protein YozB (DUF420 family)
MNGFLGAGATGRADLNLALQPLMGLALLLGMWLARQKRFRAHAICQASVLLFNLLLIASIMLPSFQLQTLPRLTTSLYKTDVAFAIVHAGLGTLAELLGLYVILVAGTKLLPAGLRFKNYKPWMRATLALWWLVILLGVGTYYFWYLKPVATMANTAPAQPSGTNANRVTIRLSNFKFEPKEVTVAPGTTVEWIDEQGNHTIAADDGSFESDILDAGGRFERKYDKPGAYPYYCTLHGSKGGHEMAGVVIVK